jgi:hypothetical protein
VPLQCTQKTFNHSDRMACITLFVVMISWAICHSVQDFCNSLYFNNIMSFICKIVIDNYKFITNMKLKIHLHLFSFWCSSRFVLFWFGVWFGLFVHPFSHIHNMIKIQHGLIKWPWNKPKTAFSRKSIWSQAHRMEVHMKLPLKLEYV